MLLIKKFFPIMVLVMMLIGLTTAAYADFNPLSDFKYPDVKTPEFGVGQSTSYAVSVSGVPDQKEPISFKMRSAIVGKEALEGKDYFWFELDLSDFKGVPPEVSQLITSLKIKCLMKKTSPAKYQADPKVAMQEFASGDLIKKVVFQKNNETPQFIDFMTIQGLVQGMTGQELTALLDTKQVEEEKIKGDFETKTGKENVTVPAGTFNNADFVWFKGSAEEGAGEGKVLVHSSIPISSLVKMTMNITSKTDSSNIKVNIELTESKNSGAISLIKGEPIPFDFQKLMGSMSGGMGE